MLKKIIPVFVITMMIFGFSVGAMAEDDYMVEIYLQTADRTVSPVDVDPINQNPITVLVEEGDTLKDAIEEAIPSAVWTGEYLVELTYDSISYTNATFVFEDISIPPEYPWTHGIWEGVMWYWFEGEPDDMPATLQEYPGGIGYVLYPVFGIAPQWCYPEITDDTVFTFSFETSSIIW